MREPRLPAPRKSGIYWASSLCFLFFLPHFFHNTGCIAEQYWPGFPRILPVLQATYLGGASKEQNCCDVVKKSLYFNSHTKGDDAIKFYSGAVSDITIGRISQVSALVFASYITRLVIQYEGWQAAIRCSKVSLLYEMVTTRWCVSFQSPVLGGYLSSHQATFSISALSPNDEQKWIEAVHCCAKRKLCYGPFQRQAGGWPASIKQWYSVYFSRWNKISKKAWLACVFFPDLCTLCPNWQFRESRFIDIMAPPHLLCCANFLLL